MIGVQLDVAIPYVYYIYIYVMFISWEYLLTKLGTCWTTMNSDFGFPRHGIYRDLPHCIPIYRKSDGKSTIDHWFLAVFPSFSHHFHWTSLQHHVTGCHCGRGVAEGPKNVKGVGSNAMETRTIGWFVNVYDGLWPWVCYGLAPKRWFHVCMYN